MRRGLVLWAIVPAIGVLVLAVFYPNFVARAGGADAGFDDQTGMTRVPSGAKYVIGPPTQPEISTPPAKPFNLHLNGQNGPRLTLSTIRDLPTALTGAETKRELEDRSARPLSLAAGDFDDDGVPDLVSGYAGDKANLLVIHRGNVDAIYADTPETNERKERGLFTDSPFLSPAQVFDVPERPDFIGTGDFNADGHRDIVVAALGSQRLYWLTGDGSGGLAGPQAVELPGTITAMTVGEMNRADGLDDVIVGIDGVSGPQILVYEGADGAFKTGPEALSLPNAATSLALGQLDDGYEMDLAAAAGSDLVIVHGRDRRTSLGEEARAEVRPAQIDVQSMPFPITSLTIGDFSGDQGSEVALLSADGVLHVVERRSAAKQWGTIAADVATGVSTSLNRCSSEVTDTSGCVAPALIRARVSLSGKDDLAVVNHADHRLQIITTEAAQIKDPAGRASAPPTMRVAASLDMDSNPVAVLPMRLNIDAFSDLVVLKNGGDSALAVALSAPFRTFTVNSTASQGDANAGDGKCETAANNGICTFPAALQEVNAGPGGDTINFSVSSITMPGAISLNITKPVTIDGGSSRVEITGSSGILITCNSGSTCNANNTIRGLVINRLSASPAIKIDTNGGNNILENNYLGTDVAGATGTDTGVDGVSISNSANNTIGGTAAAARNVIAVPRAGIRILAQSPGTKVQGNYIGTNAAGTMALSTQDGIQANPNPATSPNLTIGGATSGAGNLIACMGTQITVTGSGTLMQGNLIGTDVTGGVVLRTSSGSGVDISLGTGLTLGGTTAPARNIITGSSTRGVNVIQSTGTQIQGNYIGTDILGTKALPNAAGIVVDSASTGTIIGGTTVGARNLISGNTGSSGGISVSTGVSILGNYIGTDASGLNNLGNTGPGITVGGANSVIGDTGGGAPNIIAFSKSFSGVLISGTGNVVRRNSVFGNSSVGILCNNANTCGKKPFLSGTTGTLTAATASTSYTIDFYTNDACGGTGSEQARTFINSTTVMTDASGNVSFPIPAGQNVTATATATGANTSSLSNCIAGVPTPTPTPTPAVSDLELRFNPASPPPATIHMGVASGTYSMIVTNNGPAMAFGVTVSGSLPANTSLDTGTSNFCGAGAGTFTCTLGNIDAAPVPHATSGPGVVIFNLVLKPGAPGPITLTSSVTLDTSRTTDNVPSNNSVTTTTQVVVNVTLLGFEVTQAVQDLKNSVPLVADKPTFIRAYIGPDTASPVFGVAVSASLIGTNSNPNGVANSAIMPSNPNQKITLVQNPKRAVLRDSFYFELPANWIKAGTLQFRIASPDLSFTCSEPDGTPDCATTVTFQKTKKLSINFVGITWKDAGNVSHSPALDDLLETAGEIRARLPMWDFDWEVSSTTINDNPCTVDLDTILSTISGLRTADISNGKAVKTYYMGLLPDQSTCGDAYTHNGIANLSGHASLAFLRRNGIGGTGFGTPVMDGSARAHELSHNTGIKHTDSGGGEMVIAADYQPASGFISPGQLEYSSDTAYGFDIFNSSSNRDGAQIFASTTYDFMSYARPRWVSVFNYNKLFASIGVDTGTNAIEADPNAVSVTQTVQVSGKITQGPETGTISPLFVRNTNGTISLPAAGGYEMRLETAAGQLIASYTFDPETNSEGGFGNYSLVLPWDVNAKRIRLMHNGQELASRVASANAPTVTVTSPNGGETLGGSTATFTWTAADADGDPLVYNVDYSPDGGTTWSALATGLSSTTYTADITKLAASTQALIRVTASDGFNSTTDPSNAVFTVSTHAPQASIISPESNHLYVGDQIITLNGMAVDIEDGILNGSRLSWSSSLNGPLGTGNSISVTASTLTEGTHTITLTATDSTSRVGTATIPIRVFRTAPAFPAALAVTPAGLAFNASVGTTQTPPQILAIRNNGDGGLNWSATADQPWIRLASASGAAPSNLSITADPTSLAAGRYTGHVTITSAGAANSPQNVNVGFSIAAPMLVTVSGRVLTSDGRGLRNATVSISDSNGVVRNATTSSFGFFSFADVAVGQAYTFRVSSRLFRFASKTVTVNDNVTLPDFVGLE